MTKTLTIFTPTYNRAYCLSQCYESLVRQTMKDFIWLIIDDGSADNTSSLVAEWKERDNGFEIQYLYKENGGIHTAHNKAYQNISTELNMCVDSDDYLTDDAVETVLKFWKENGSEEYCGIIALDMFSNGSIIGKLLPDLKAIHLVDYYHKGGKGDKKLIYRTDIMKHYPEYPVFEGENFIASGLKYFYVDQEYKLLLLNKPICIVEYRSDGYTMNLYKKMRYNPKGFAYYKWVQLRYEKYFMYQCKYSIQYVAFSLMAKNRKFIQTSNHKALTVIMIPVAIMYYFYVLFKNRK
jgi:Glycosyltransferases involved in cell wall biogenesis